MRLLIEILGEVESFIIAERAGYQ